VAAVAGSVTEMAVDATSFMGRCQAEMLSRLLLNAAVAASNADVAGRPERRPRKRRLARPGALGGSRRARQVRSILRSECRLTINPALANPLRGSRVS
jgi:hypothetical protein